MASSAPNPRVFFVKGGVPFSKFQIEMALNYALSFDISIYEDEQGGFKTTLGSSPDRTAEYELNELKKKCGHSFSFVEKTTFTLSIDTLGVTATLSHIKAALGMVNDFGLGSPEESKDGKFSIPMTLQRGFTDIADQLEALNKCSDIAGVVKFAVA
jgi:hypothetical protein